jgi:mRNA interferase MazF
MKQQKQKRYSGQKRLLEMSAMNRGEVWWVEFPNPVGGEIQKRRPCVIVSNDVSNRFLNRVQIVPLTSSVEKLRDGEAYVNVAGKAGKALATQIQTASKLRLRRKMARLTDFEIEQVEEAIRVQLGLDK